MLVDLGDLMKNFQLDELIIVCNLVQRNIHRSDFPFKIRKLKIEPIRLN